MRAVFLAAVLRYAICTPIGGIGKGAGSGVRGCLIAISVDGHGERRLLIYSCYVTAGALFSIIFIWSSIEYARSSTPGGTKRLSGGQYSVFMRHATLASPPVRSVQ